MRVLKAIVRWFFAIQATILFVIPLASIFGGVSGHLRTWLATSVVTQPHHKSTEVAAFAGLASLLAFGFTFAMAWWTTRKASAGSGSWAVAASSLNIGQGALLLLAEHLSRGRIHIYPADALCCIALGVVGVIIFLRPGEFTATSDLAMEQISIPDVEPRALAGDRRSSFARHAGELTGCITQVVAIVLWSRWAAAHGLEHTHVALLILFVLFATIVAAFIHECGHAILSWCFEMSLTGFNVGPLQCEKREGEWSFKLRPALLLVSGGAADAVSNDHDQPRWEEVLMVTAGSLANLLIGVPALYAVLHDSWPHYEQTWELVALTASFCLIAAVLNLLPFSTDEDSYTDGARLLQILTHSRLDQYRIITAQIASTRESPRCYRDLDVATIQHVADLFSTEFRGLSLHLSASNCFVDSSSLPEAAAELVCAETIYNDFHVALSWPLHATFVIGHALLTRDAAKARLWWNRMEAMEIEMRDVEYLLASTALNWLEGDAKVAEELWSEANLSAQELPQTGVGEFARFRCTLLQRALDGGSQVIVSAPLLLTNAEPVDVAPSSSTSDGTPILPAWISAPATPIAADTSAVIPATEPPAPTTRETVVPPQHPSGITSGDEPASVFARLAAITARSTERQRSIPKAVPDKITSVAPPATDDPAAQVEEKAHAAPECIDPFDRILQSKPDRSLSDRMDATDVPPVSQSIAMITRESNSICAPAPGAPPLLDALTVVPLSVDGWKSAPTYTATVVSTPSSASIATSGPSVPSAFARRPRVINPPAEFLFDSPQIVEPIGIEAGISEELQSDSELEHANLQPAEVSERQPHPAISVLPTKTVVLEAREVGEIEALTKPQGNATPTPAPAPVEPPKFDALAFIRAAAIENLST